MGEEKVGILMVDDNEQKLSTYEAILEELGEKLIKARSANEALNLLLTEDIGLLLLDVSMPEIDGLRLAEMIHEHPRFDQIPIIFISAIHITDVDQLRGYKGGAVDYVCVPVNPELLRAKVSVFVKLHRSSARLEALNAELGRLSDHLHQAQDRERRRIARELHDGLAQNIGYAVMTLDSAARQQDRQGVDAGIANARASLEEALRQARSMSYLLHPPELDEFGLRPALPNYLQEFGKRSGIETALAIEPNEFPRLRSELETSVFRIVQECLANVVRHSQASRVWVSLNLKENVLVVTVRDNGRGFPAETVKLHPHKLGVGLAGMKQRAKELGGQLRLVTDSGATVEIKIPV